ncbi:MAG TPA: ABC transporter permease subunit [Candidatus Hydrogenedentes bacterium]|nr:ABC transporter permease subunit [Candidatus Hydrogenedentota bacterium]HRK33173.1 ABC transporter permease subunit [Candidatus Hydrogenedentota bacterium]
MRSAWSVAKRELSSFFTTPVGYVIVGTYAAISGLGFAASFTEFCAITVNPAEKGYEGVPKLEELLISPYLLFCGQLLMFIGPLITMRLLAEERSRGTIELLLTYPLRDRDIVFGKYGAAMIIVLVLMSIVGVHLAVVGYYTDVEPAVLAFGLLTLFLMSGAFMSLGLFVSAWTRSPVTAGIVTFALWFISYIVGTFGQSLPAAPEIPAQLGVNAARAIAFFWGIFRQLVVELPLDRHAERMAQGIVQPQDIAYYVLFTAFFLFLTFRALESRQWRA